MTGTEIAPRGPWSKELVQEIAMDIGKDVVAYIEVMYPEAIKATSSTFKLSVRNSIYNKIMAAIELTDEGQIRGRMRDHKKFRREWTAAWRKIRAGQVQRTEGNFADDAENPCGNGGRGWDRTSDPYDVNVVTTEES